MEPISGDKLRGHLETMLLAALEAGPTHGLDLLGRLDDAGCGLLKLKEGSLYPALYRLEAAGLVRGAWEEDTGGRRGARRRQYCLSAKGRRRLAQGREEWTTFVRVIGGILGATA